MMAQSIRCSSSLLARVTRTATPVARRSFTASVVVRRPDILQQMYLNQIKSYEAPAAQPSDSEGHVQIFKAPSPPKSPEETDLASETKAYEDQVVETEDAAVEGGTMEAKDNYFEDLEDAEPAHDAAH